MKKSVNQLIGGGSKFLLFIFLGIFLVSFVIANSVLNIFPLESSNVYFGNSINFTCSVNSSNSTFKKIELYSNYSDDTTSKKIMTNYSGDFTNVTQGNSFIVNYVGQNYSVNPTRLETRSGSVCTYGASAQDPCSLLVMTNWLGGSSIYWAATSSSTQVNWVKFNLDEIFLIDSLFLAQHPTVYARNVTLESSLDNSTWQTLFNVTNASNSVNYTLETPVKAKYIRLTVANSSSTGIVYVNYLNISGKRYNYSGVFNVSFNQSLNYPYLDHSNYSYYCSMQNTVNETYNSSQTFFTLSYYHPQITASTDKSSYLDNETINLTCGVTSNDTLQSMNYYVNNTGNYFLGGQYFGETLYGLDGNSLLNLSVSKPNESAARITYVQYPLSSGALASCSTDYLGFQCASAVLVNYDWNNSNSRYWIANTPTYLSNTITYDLNGDYFLNTINIVGHPSISDYGIAKINISFSEDNSSWTQVYSNASMTSSNFNITITPTKVRYVNVTVWRDSGITYFNHLQFYGKKYIIGNYAQNYSWSISKNWSRNGTFESVKCSAKTINGAETNYSLNLSIWTIPKILNLTAQPSSILTGERAFFSCNASWDNTTYTSENITTYLQYRLDDENWVDATYRGYSTPRIIYSIGDSITATQIYQTYLDSFMGSNISSYNFGVGGHTCDNIYSRYDSNITNGTTVIIWCGINDVISNGNQTEEVQQDMVNIQNLAESKNNTVIWLTIGTASNVPGAFEEIVAINNWMSKNFSKNYNLTLVDVYHGLWNGTDAYCSTSPSYCNADGLHINSAGGYVVANLIWKNVFNYTKFNQFGYYSDIYSNSASSFLDVRCSASNGGIISNWYTVNNLIEVINTSQIVAEANLDSPSGGIQHPSTSSLTEGYSRNFVKGQKIEITVDGEKEIITINKILENEVQFSVSGNNYSVAKNETKKFDLNSDGVYDLQISVEKIYTNGIAQMEFKLINEKIPSTEQKPAEEQTQNETPTEKSNNLVWIILSGIVLIGIIFVLIKIINLKRFGKKYGRKW